MEMILFSEKEFASGLWFQKEAEGIRKAAEKRNISLRFIGTEELESSTAEELFGSGARLLTILGASISHMDRLIQTCRSKGIRMLFANFEPRGRSHDTSSVVMDYSDTMERIFACFSDCAKTRPALLGVNPDSAADRLKEKCMRAHGEPDDSIFYNDRGIEALMSDFLSKKDRFDSLIFTNDVVMLAASAILREAGLRIPEDYYAVSFSDTMLSPIFKSPLSPGISTFSLDYCELGRQCAELWNYLSRSSADICATVRVRADFYPDRSTGSKAPPSGNAGILNPVSETYDFYSDDLVSEVIALENCLIQCDETDFKILGLLMRGENRTRMAMELFISEGTLYYRQRRLCRLANADSVSRLKELLNKYLRRC